MHLHPAWGQGHTRTNPCVVRATEVVRRSLQQMIVFAKSRVVRVGWENGVFTPSIQEVPPVSLSYSHIAVGTTQLGIRARVRFYDQCSGTGKRVENIGRQS